MLTRVTPIEFSRSTTSGRNKPALLVCQKPSGETVELIAKFSASCDEGAVNLAREVVAGCLAGDLGLPIPEPFLVEVSPEWSDSIPETGQRQRIKASAPVAFGSQHVGNQFSLWNRGTKLSVPMIPVAAATFVFDAIIQNPDRRPDNPNCLVRGDAIRIFDHELAFMQGMIIGWQPPWLCGSLKSLETPDFHIFRLPLRGVTIDFGPIRKAWVGLSDERIAEYEQAIPPEWSGVGAAVTGAAALIKGARDQIDACLQEIQRVLT
jgi:hypothetical protein